VAINQEYCVAAQVWRLSSADMCEIARNSVLQSGFEYPWKAHFIGPNYAVAGPLGNDIHLTNVPYIRLQYRLETLVAELQLVEEGVRTHRESLGAAPPPDSVRHVRAKSGRHMLPSGLSGVPVTTSDGNYINFNATPVTGSSAAPGQHASPLQLGTRIAQLSDAGNSSSLLRECSLPGAAPGVTAAAAWSAAPHNSLSTDFGSVRFQPYGNNVESARSSSLPVKF
jgi:hypothetical protein